MHQGSFESWLPAVDQHGPHVGGLGGGRPAHEGEDGQGVLWDPHVRPLGVVVLDHRPLALTALRVPLLPLQEGGGRRRRRGCEKGEKGVFTGS